MALSKYLSGETRWINHAYHCARHALRALAVEKAGTIFQTNDQLMASIGSLGFRKVLAELVEARKRKPVALEKHPRQSFESIPKGRAGELLLSAERVAMRSAEKCLMKKGAQRPPGA